MTVEGDPKRGYTETHQVIARVGYGKGPLMAERLEENNIIVNYQRVPDDEAFTTASCLRMGVQEMTRFGMKEEDFGELAGYMSEVILHNRSVANEIAQFRKRFTEMKYCLPEEEATSLVNRLIEGDIYAKSRLSISPLCNIMRAELDYALRYALWACES